MTGGGQETPFVDKNEKDENFQDYTSFLKSVRELKN